MNSVSKATPQERYLTMEVATAVSGALLRDSEEGYVDPIHDPRLASSVTRCLDLDVTRVRKSKAKLERLVKLFVVADEHNPPRFPCTGVACFPIVIPEARRDSVSELGVNTMGYTMHLILNCPDLIELYRLLDGEVHFGLIDAPAGMIVVLRLANLMTFGVPIFMAAGDPCRTLPERGTAQDNGVMLKFFERATGNQCFARFVVLPREFMQRLREGFERAMGRTPSAASELVPWMQRHLPSIEEAWRLRDHRGVGRDCPVQAVWSSERDWRTRFA
jgi:hypothetical protein